MSILYRLLGIIARMNERLSHTRVNFVPLNIAIMAGLGALLAVGFTATSEAIVNGQTPRSTTIAEALNHPNAARNYVTVSGVYLPVAAFKEYSEHYGSKSDTGRVWAPLVDVEGKRAILVETKQEETVNENAKGDIGKDTTITGMVVAMPSDLISKVEETNQSGIPITMNTQYMLVKDKKPGSASVWGLATAISGVLLALSLFTLLNKYVVFQKTDARVASAIAAPFSQGIDLHVTGKFVLDEKNSKRFLDMPAGITTLETGDLALVSNINAVSRFMGVTTARREGLWAIIISPGSLHKMEKGLLYVGAAPRPALRIRFKEAVSSKPSEAVLSCATDSEREALIQELNKTAGYSVLSS